MDGRMLKHLMKERLGLIKLEMQIDGKSIREEKATVEATITFNRIVKYPSNRFQIPNMKR